MRWEIIKKTHKLIVKIWKYDPFDDGACGWPYFGGSKETVPGSHYKLIKELQISLKKDIKKYIDECLKNRDPGDGPQPKSIPDWVDDYVNIYVQPPFILNLPDNPGGFGLSPGEGGGFGVPEFAL